MKPSLISLFEQELVRLNVKKEDQILVAVSGGLDSMVLADLCRQINVEFDIAHFNYGLRGEESDLDQELVQNYCLKHGIALHLKKLPKNQLKKGAGVQERARHLRYQWFYQILKEKNLRYIFTAHHDEDFQETFLINAVRGSGLKGLSSIPEVNGVVVRPLLRFQKNQLKKFAKNIELGWREDNSNASNDYLRNRIRNSVLPSLWESDKRAKENLSQSIRWLQQADDFVKILAQEFCKRVEEEGTFELSDEDWIYLFERKPMHKYVFERWGFPPNLLAQLEVLLQRQSGKVIVGENYRVYRDRSKMIFEPIQFRSKQEFTISQSFGNLDLPFELKWKELDLGDLRVIPKSSKIAVIELTAVNFPLKLRRWKASDRFQPLGMNGTKKLSDFFVDLKLSMPQKKEVWVLTSKEEIIWVVGFRIDEKFKITSQSKKAIIFELT